MNTLLALSILVIAFVGVLALLERTQRRTVGLPRAPFGADADRDADLARVLHELDADRAHLA
jgi:hypothetical protein